jgi:hypothetical protein
MRTTKDIRVLLAIGVIALAALVVFTACDKRTPSDSAVSGEPGEIFFSPDSRSINIRRDSLASETFIVLLTNDSGIGISGAEVQLSRTGPGYITQESDTTDENGQLEVTYWVINEYGEATLIAGYGGLNASAAITITGPLGVQIIDVDPNIVYADGGISTAEVIVSARTMLDSPLVNMPVFFSATHGSFTQASVNTDDAGIAINTYESGSTVGTDTIIATVSGESDTAYIQLVAPLPVPPDSLVLTVTPPILVAGQDSARLSVVVFDSTGMPVDNVPIRFTTSAGSLTNYGYILTVSGVAEDTLIASNQIITAMVVATAGGTGLADTVYVDFEAGPPNSIYLDADPDTIPVSTGQSAITAFVTDANNNPVADGTVIEFESVYGLGNINPQAFTFGGYANVTFIAGPDAGIAQIGATWGDTAQGAGDTVFVYIASGGPNSIALTAEEVVLQVQGTGGVESSPVTATVMDAGGNPVSDGTEVFFEITLGPGGGENWNNTGLDTITVTTLNGDATVALNSGNVPGTITIRATSGPVSTSKSNIVIVSGPPEHITLSAALSDVHLIGSLLRYEVAALVTDVYGNQVVDSTSVWFSILPADRGEIVGEAFTGNENLNNVSYPGVAFTQYIYGSEHELLPITIIAQSGTVWDTITHENPIYQPAILLTADPGFLEFTAPTQVLTSTITAQLFDGLGNPVGNGTILYQSDRGWMTPSTNVTNADGIATSTLSVRGSSLPADPPTTAVEVEAFLQGYILEEEATTTVNCYRNF